MCGPRVTYVRAKLVAMMWRLLCVSTASVGAANGHGRQKNTQHRHVGVTRNAAQPRRVDGKLVLGVTATDDFVQL